MAATETEMTRAMRGSKRIYTKDETLASFDAALADVQSSIDQLERVRFTLIQQRGIVAREE